ncbi:MAG: acetyl-CoA carboxylase carboxyltransferase subunit alpha [Candidatus Faecalibacterium intestinavium]|uniref:Acetyl-coenzyme A carboxylase carboxyl transferase subunit alpha n=1 Tax=Candidatus Faecalibacterium intestinavium TaxID=2838580 RepID=A0A9E2KLF0_9FIRM|nr:acetyl-CoA carboxylase carboxyltransferase subunit alpha [Candidatus Faecalibacterium intestinavium]
MIRDVLKMTDALEAELAALEGDNSPQALLRVKQLQRDRTELLDSCTNLTAEDKVFLARHPRRPKIDDYISALFTDFFEQKGDRQCREDASILGGIAFFKGAPVTVIGHRKGNNLEENMKYNFGMPGPEGYRKALRLMKQAEKFGRPVITFIDTPGAYPGKEAEERGQGEAIARNLAEMSQLSVPVITVVTGEGSSGGALALGVANKVLMLENAVYSVLSPEGFASILWKDASRHGEACDVMKLTAQDLYQFGVIEEIVPEPLGGAQTDPKALYTHLELALERSLASLRKMSPAALEAQRYKKFRQIGQE